eukprot:796537-Amphidinium_carterae.1
MTLSHQTADALDCTQTLPASALSQNPWKLRQGTPQATAKSSRHTQPTRTLTLGLGRRRQLHFDTLRVWAVNGAARGMEVPPGASVYARKHGQHIDGNHKSPPANSKPHQEMSRPNPSMGLVDSLVCLLHVQRATHCDGKQD